MPDIRKIDDLKDIISESIDWVSTSQNIKSKEERENAYTALTQARRELKRIRRAISVNPATVVFGESQKGKSYLVTALLGEDEQPFYVIDTSNNTRYNFKTDINPIGGGIESTGLVTRFTISPVSPVKGFPVKIKMLSIPDIILVLCDSYFSDLKDQQYEKINDITDTIKRLESQYTCAVPITEPLMDEDDVMEIRNYIDHHFHAFASQLTANDVQFFERVSKLIDRVPIDKYTDVFSYVWYKNPFFTELFQLLLEKYGTINYAKEVYVSYEALLRTGGAILDVERLKEIYNAPNDTVDLRYYVNDQLISAELDRAFLSALAAEAVCQLADELKNSKPFLSESDILDFPGWRRRENIVEGNLKKEVMPGLLLRGKVAYFFHNYSENQMISCLLLCHDHEQTAQSEMPELIDQWLCNTMCTDAWKQELDRQEQYHIQREERSRFIETSKISPLFIVMTKFNLDLKYDSQNDKADSLSTLTQRWDDRFVKVLDKELLHTEIHPWFNDWCTNHPQFDNIYLLRDFHFSSENENRLFKGWTKDGGKEQEEIPVAEFPDFRNKLKQTFVEHPFVKNHFTNPEESWDAAATVGHDGTVPIINNLGRASKNIGIARAETFDQKITNITNTIYRILDTHHYKGNADDNLRKAIRRASELSDSFILAFNTQRNLFGYLMDRMLLNPIEIFNTMHFALASGTADSQTGHDRYAVMFERYKHIIDSPKTYNEKLTALAEERGADIKDCIEFFSKKGINMHTLLNMRPQPPKTTSDILGERICAVWLNQMKKVSIVSEYLSPSDVNELVSLYINLFDILKVKAKIIEELRPFESDFNQANNDGIIAMVSDICTEKLNQFVITAGRNIYGDKHDDEKIKEIQNNLSKIAAKHPALIHPSFDGKKTSTVVPANDICRILRDIDNPPLQGGFQPGVKDRSEWLNDIKMGILSTSNIPDYNIEDNKKLSDILERLSNHNNKHQ